MKSQLIAFALFAFTAAGVAVYPAYKSIGALAPTDPRHANLPPVDPLGNERSRRLSDLGDRSEQGGRAGPFFRSFEENSRSYLTKRIGKMGRSPTGAVDQSQVRQPPSVEVVFVLDTTGSMGGLIQAAKEKIWSIATSLAQAQTAPDIRMGLVGYRDRGDAYVTRVVDLSDDLDSMYATLMDFQAEGGGDAPESVNQALYDAVHKIAWSQDDRTYKVVFLVGDAPPHMDYQDDVKYPETLAAALNKGILVNAIQCGEDGTTTPRWQQIAQLGKGSYFRVEQAGGAVAITTPFDRKLAELSARLDDTRVYYGTAAEKEAQQRKLDATHKLQASSSVASRARRATFNASESGTLNFLGKGELVDDIASGRVDLPGVAPEKLPESLRAMSPAEQEAFLKDKATRRDELQQAIRQLSEKRAAYLKTKIEAAGGARDSLDDKIYRAVREQAATKGFVYEADAPAY